MGIRFNASRVDAWFKFTCKALEPQEVALLWIHLAYGVPLASEQVNDPLFGVPAHLWVDWNRFSLWEKQAALYLFGPVLEKNANHQAWLKCQEARKLEPL